MSFNKSFIWNLVGSVLPLLVGVFTIPFLIEQLELQLFGILTLIWALIGYFSLFDFGLGRALTQIIAKYKGDDQKTNTYSCVGLALITAFGIFGASIIVLSVMIFSVNWLGIDEKYVVDVKKAIFIAALGIPLTTLATGCRGILEGFFEFGLSNVIRLIMGVGNFLLPAVAVVFWEPNLSNVALSLLIARLIVIIISLYYVLRFISLNLGYFFENDKNIYRELLSFGSWMTLSNIVSPLMVTSDRFFISAIAGAAAVAYYTVPFEIVIRALILPAALTSVYFAYASNIENQDSESAQKLYREKLKQTFWMMLVIGFGIATLSRPFLSLWIGVEFSERAWLIMTIMGIGVFFNGLAQMPLASIHARGMARIVALIHVSEILLYVPILMALIYYYGAMGAALAWLCRAIFDFSILSYFELKTRYAARV
ncbi:flippase [Salinispirillum marinum]|uniref:Flippase n=2 Tax=Saccharospirillaceae TaxID=255527 RepID=A0ABV8BD60_9GAMM